MEKIIGKNWYIVKPSKKELEEKYKSSRIHAKEEKECIICKTKFKYGRKDSKNCKLHKLFCPCPICGKIHEVNFNSLSGTTLAEIRNKIINNEEIYNCCSKKCKNSLIINNQKENKTGWFSKESINKRNSSEHQIVRNKHAIENGNKINCVKGQLKNGTHPTQNLEMQAKKCLLMQLHNLGFKELKLDDLKDKKYIDYLNLVPIKINENSISYEESFIYDNRCGSIGLYGKYKKDNKVYALNAGKSINLGKEIRKFWRIISNPEKQNIEEDYGRWYHISNDYTNFEIKIICIDVSEQEALLKEAAWAMQNNANFKYTVKNGKKVQIENTHGYWM